MTSKCPKTKYKCNAVHFIGEKIKYKPKEFLPLPDSLVLLKLGDYDYRFARLFEITQSEGKAEETETKVYFLGETDSEGGLRYQKCRGMVLCEA